MEISAADLAHIDQLMRRGILTEPATGREYFTGYDYRVLYDWDQYFEAIVQLYLGWDKQYIVNGILIFLDMQQPDGFIPRRVPAPAGRTETEMVKPFLAQIALLLFKRFEHTWLTDEYYLRLKKYLLYWLEQKDKNGNGLSTWDSAEHSGMDDQLDRAGGPGTCYCEGVDLNCFLCREMAAFAVIAETLGRQDDALEFSRRAEQMKERIRADMWCEADGFFYDLDERTGEFIRVKSSACFSVLWAGAATETQARRLVREHLLNPREFWRAFPVPSYAATEPGYREENLPEDVGCNWRAHTWVPVNYYLMHGLQRYGCGEIAQIIADRTCEVVKSVGDREYYTSDSVRGQGLDPFWGWTLLAYFMPYEARTGADPTEVP